MNTNIIYLLTTIYLPLVIYSNIFESNSNSVSERATPILTEKLVGENNSVREV